MSVLSLHKYQTGSLQKPRFDPLAMAPDLIAALNLLDTRGGWRLTEHHDKHFRHPVEISRCNAHSIVIQCGYPDEMRGEAGLHCHARPQHWNDLPDLPKCTFNPLRPVEAVARDILRKIDAKADEISGAYLSRVDSETKAKDAHTALLGRLSLALGKPLVGNGSGTRYFEVGPLRFSVDDRGNIKIETYSYVSEDQLIALIGLFGDLDAATDAA